MADKPVVELAADGTIKCAKGLDISECGYKVGDKVCAKCGAQAVSVKTSFTEEDGWVSFEEVTGKGGNMMMGGSPMSEMAEDVEDEVQDAVSKRKKARKKRMDSMGVKSADWDDDSFVCAFERKMYPGASQVCAQCPGGCAPEQDMPTLLEVEGIAEDMFSGKVLDSGYSDETDIFVVDVQRKDGKPIEAFFNGSTGECMGWHLLNEAVIGEVVEIGGTKVISFAEAAALATKSIAGDVVAVDADMFEGYDAFAVEVDGLDGKSYDVFVSLDGEILGWDEYDADEAADIDAEVADIALKRMYDEETRGEMAKGGMALPDGSFPIKDEEDLKNAIQAFGRAKDKAAAKAHIMKRASDLDAMDMIPEGWDSEKEYDMMEDDEEMENEEKALLDDEATKFLNDLLEFEMLEIEQGIEE